MFAALAAEDVNLKMITTGDIKISVLVDRNDGVKALRAVHQAFQLDQPRPGAGKPAGPLGPIPFRRRSAREARTPAGGDLPAVPNTLAGKVDDGDRNRLRDHKTGLK